MAINAQNTELSVTPGGIIPIVHVTQYDKNRVLTFNLMDGNNAASLPSGATVIIEGTKPSRHGFSYEATLSGSTVTVNTTQQMTAEEGTVDCKIKITAGSQIIGTALFLMEVEQAGISDNTIVSDTELPMIITLAYEQEANAAASASSAASSASTATTAATLATTMATLSESWAVGDTNTRTGENTNNSKYWCQLAMAALQEVSALAAVIKLLIGTVYFTTESGDNLITEDGDMLIMDY